MQVTVLSWNLFHGRDHPPDPALHTTRSRLLRATERGPTHAQVNRDLRTQFTTMLATADWDVALLQECPPRWADPLAAACGADAHLAPTSRNLPFPLSRAQAKLADLNPDLLASWEGGSNLTLVRPISGAPTPPIAARRSLRLATRPERRVMSFTKLSVPVAIVNLHASTDRAQAEREVLRAAHVGKSWADDAPLIFGGDLNIRPRSSGPTFEALASSCGLATPQPEAGNESSAEEIDHLLAAGARATTPPARWRPEQREVPDPTAPSSAVPLPIRLSDHAPVVARFELGAGVPQADR